MIPFLFLCCCQYLSCVSRDRSVFFMVSSSCLYRCLVLMFNFLVVSSLQVG